MRSEPNGDDNVHFREFNEERAMRARSQFWGSTLLVLMFTLLGVYECDSAWGHRHRASLAPESYEGTVMAVHHGKGNSVRIGDPKSGDSKDFSLNVDAKLGDRIRIHFVRTPIFRTVVLDAYEVNGVPVVEKAVSLRIRDLAILAVPSAITLLSLALVTLVSRGGSPPSGPKRVFGLLLIAIGLSIPIFGMVLAWFARASWLGWYLLVVLPCPFAIFIAMWGVWLIRRCISEHHLSDVPTNEPSPKNRV